MAERTHLRVLADRSRCIGSGMCVMTDPDVFDQSDDDGCVVVAIEHPDERHRDAVERAVRNCPSHSLRIEDSTAGD